MTRRLPLSILVLLLLSSASPVEVHLVGQAVPVGPLRAFRCDVAGLSPDHTLRNAQFIETRATGTATAERRRRWSAEGSVSRQAPTVD